MRAPHRYVAVLVIFLSLDSAFSIEKDGGLYKTSDRVIKLNDTTFNALTSKTFTTNWLIQFYHSSCGHCINFSRYFKIFAADVYSWRDTVTLGVLDCRFYGDICKANIKGFPSLLFYRVGQDSSSKKSMKAQFSVRNLTENLVDALSFESFLQPKTKESLKSLEDKSVVIADPNGYLAKEIILDLRYVGKPLFWVQGKYTDGELALGESSSTPADVAMLVMMSGRLNVLHSGIKKRETARLAIEAVWGNITRPGESAPSGDSKNKAPIYVHKTAKYPQFEDIFSAISMAFRKDVPLLDVVEGADMVTLKKFLRAVTEYLHNVANVSSHNETFNIIAGMFSEFEKKVKDVSSINTNDWKKKFDEAVPMPKSENWIFCSGSKSFFRGYPCGLWTLFHSLTAMNCRKNPHLRGEDSRFVVRSLRDFVVTFFSCRHCAKNFKTETKDLDSVNSTCGAMMWLWRIHNSVNKRLAGKLSEDPEYPKVPFPTVELCPSCRNNDSGSPGLPSWHPVEVRSFLLSFFTPAHFVTKKDSKIVSFATEYEGSKEAASTTVMSAMIGLTVTVVAVVIILVVAVKLYKKRKTPENAPLTSSNRLEKT